MPFPGTVVKPVRMQPVSGRGDRRASGIGPASVARSAADNNLAATGSVYVSGRKMPRRCPQSARAIRRRLILKKSPVPAPAVTNDSRSAVARR